MWILPRTQYLDTVTSHVINAKNDRERSVRRLAIVCPFLCHEMTCLCANNAKTFDLQDRHLLINFLRKTSCSCLITPAFNLRLATTLGKDRQKDSWLLFFGVPLHIFLRRNFWGTRLTYDEGYIVNKMFLINHDQLFKVSLTELSFESSSIDINWR